MGAPAESTGAPAAHPPPRVWNRQTKRMVNIAASIALFLVILLASMPVTRIAPK